MPSTPHRWDPCAYLAFAGERGRPFLDLLSRLDAENPRAVADLGAGPGTLTALLHERWPDATIFAVDSSQEMIERAREAPGITPQAADLTTWAPPGPLDVIVSNAALQWVPGHLELLPRLLAPLAPGGWFGMQVPGNFAEPSHTLLERLGAREPFAAHLTGIAAPASHDAGTYLAALQDLGLMVDAWETTYLHVLTGPDPVLAWISGTGARPTLQALPEDLQEVFVAEYREMLRAAYPPDVEGRVVMPFRRIFAVGRRS